MGDLRLFRLGQLGKGLGLFRHEKDRVITEAVLPHGGKGDGAGGLPLGGDGVSVGESAGDRAGEVGRPGGLAPEILQQQGIRYITSF